MELGKSTYLKTKGKKSFEYLISLSSYHRAIAMIPASKGNIVDTRKHMIMAEEYAKQAIPQTRSEKHKAFDSYKTIVESSLKEMLYMGDRYEEAEELGKELIGMDPLLSISWHELAEVYTQWESGKMR
ncbi:hypothetical protein P4S72_15405 [Vibrio sp. PP-XX7]